MHTWTEEYHFAIPCHWYHYAHLIIIDENVDVDEEFIKNFQADTFVLAIKELGSSELKDYTIPYLNETEFYHQIDKWTDIFSEADTTLMFTKDFCGWQFGG